MDELVIVAVLALKESRTKKTCSTALIKRERERLPQVGSMFLTTLCNKAVCSRGDVTSYMRVNLKRGE